MMKLRNALVISLSVLGAASSALGQADVYVSGLQHVALGDAQFGPVDGRRLPVHNLGSSGEDGVEVQLNSALGGGAEIELGPFLSTPGASLRHKHKGWDGLIYGNHRMVSNGDGTALLTCDYSEVGATEITIQRQDVNGDVVSSDTYLGPIVDLPLDHQIFYCPPGTIPVAGVWVGKLCNTCPIITVFVFYCDGVMYTEALVIIPTFPAGTPENPGFESLRITGSGLPELAVSNANIRAFGMPSWGLGQAHVSEECTPDSQGGCDDADRRLVLANLGSSGEDGVAIDVPTNGGSVAAARGGTKGCCRGHVIIMKLYDDEGQEQRISRTEIPNPNGAEELDADFSSLGATGYVLTLYGASGDVLGPPEGTAIFSGGPKPVLTNLCPPGAQEWWINMGPPSNPVWVFQGCIGGWYDFVLPGYGPVSNVDSFRVRPLAATLNFGPRAHLEIVSDDPDGLVFDEILITQAVTGDLNCDNALTFADINPFVLRLSSPAAYHAAFPGCPDTNGDTNGDGSVDFGDINAFVSLLSSGG